jgi:putative NADH-flavin reductase
LLSSSDPAIKSLQISATVRRQDQANLFREKGVKPILIKDLEDSEALTNAAREHDIVINSANSFHPSSATALISGLGERKKQMGKEVHFIQVSKKEDYVLVR